MGILFRSRPAGERPIQWPDERRRSHTVQSGSQGAPRRGHSACGCALRPERAASGRRCQLQRWSCRHPEHVGCRARAEEVPAPRAFERDDAPLPDLPPARDVLRASLGARGPLKPTLVDAFTPRGYDCRGDSGTFSLRRRTAANHVVDLELDVGTWSRSLTFMFHVYGPGFTATLMPPVTLRGDDRQYPIGDTASWERIVANMAAIVDELDRTFVVEIDEAAGPAPSGSIRAANPSTCAESPSHAIGPLSLDVLPRWWRCRSSSWASSPQRHALPPRPRRPAPR